MSIDNTKTTDELAHTLAREYDSRFHYHNPTLDNIYIFLIELYPDLKFVDIYKLVPEIHKAIPQLRREEWEKKITEYLEDLIGVKFEYTKLDIHNYHYNQTTMTFTGLDISCSTHRNGETT